MYKFLKNKYANLLLNENSIRIGTLYGYRDMEQTEENKGRYDPLEGTYEDHLGVVGTSMDYHTNPVFRDNLQGYINFGLGTNVDIDIKIESKRRSPNFLIFCFSHTKSIDVMQEFKDADTCYQITKPETFFRLITWELERKFQHHIEFLGWHKVSYKPYQRQRSAIDSRPIHPALAKTEEFLPQCELRAIWEIPQELITEPYYDLEVFGLRKFCRIVEL